MAREDTPHSQLRGRARVVRRAAPGHEEMKEECNMVKPLDNYMCIRVRMWGGPCLTNFTSGRAARPVDSLCIYGQWLIPVEAM